MKRRLFSLAATAALVVSACGAGASPVPASPVPASPVATATPSATLPPASPSASTPATAAAVSVPIADVAGQDRFVAQVPADWITLTAADIASVSSLAAWRAAHPEVTEDSAKTVADDMATGGVALFAFDAAYATSGFTPNLNVTWIDAPVRDIAAWIASQAPSVTKEYALDAPLEYSAWTPAGADAIGGFVGSYRYSMQGRALAGIQMIAPQPDGRAAVLTFTCGGDQTDHYSPIVEALFTSLSAEA